MIELVNFYFFLSIKDGNNVVQIVTSGLARQRAEQLNTKLGYIKKKTKTTILNF